MNPIIQSMNDMLGDWKKQFDIFNVISFAFAAKEDFLYLGSHEVCRLPDNAKISYAEFDAHGLQVTFNECRSVIVAFRWPEDQPPEVSYVGSIQMLSDAEPFRL